MGLIDIENATQFVVTENPFDALADMARGLAGPDDVTECRRGMVKHIDADTRVVGAGDERVTRAEAGADEAEARVSALLQPVEARANVNDGLPHRIDAAANIGGDRVVRAGETGGATNVVVRHAHAQGRDTKHVEDLAETVLADAVGVPLR